MKSRKTENEIEELVLKVQKGDRDAFGKIYDTFVDSIYRYVFYRVNESDTEDLVENVFLKVWEHIGGYKKKKNRTFSSWIFRIAHNLVVDYYRGGKNKPEDPLEDYIPDQKREHNPIKITEDGFDQKILKAALKKLKKNYREFVIYKFINDLSNREIALILKKSEGSLRILQHRALKALKYELENMGVKYHK